MKKSFIYKFAIAIVFTTSAIVSAIAQDVEGIESFNRQNQFKGQETNIKPNMSPTDILNTDCEMTFGQEVHPITRVAFAGIDNVSDAEVNNSDGHEYFTELEGNVQAGERYEFLVEGNTNGDHMSAVAVYIDWNQNEIFEEYERYDIGTLINTTGTDGKALINTILVPENALSGSARLRVIKKWADGTMAPCIDGHVGQAEDYRITVTASPNACVVSSDGSLERIEENLQEVIIADDFFVEAGSLMHINQIQLNLFSEVKRADIHIFEDNDGNPGMRIKSFNNMSPSVSISQGEHDGHTVYNTIFNLSSYKVDGGEQGKIYWIGLQAQENQELEGNYCEKASSSSLSPAHYSTDGGESWTPISSESDIAVSILAGCYDDYNLYSCGQEYYSSGNVGVGVRMDEERHFAVANDFIIEPETTFSLNDIRLWLNTQSGDLTTIVMNIYSSINDSIGEKLDIDPESYTVNVYPDGVRAFSRKFAIEFIFDEPLEFQNNTEENVHYWVSISAGNSTEGDFVFWAHYLYDENPSHPTWNSLDGGETWKVFEQARTGNNTEGQMIINGTCNEPTVSTSNPELTNITFYPNPVQEVLNFKATKPVKSISIFNLQGQQVMFTESADNSINVSDLGSGLFFAKFSFKDGSAETLKFMKQ